MSESRPECIWFDGMWPLDSMLLDGKALYAEKRWRGLESILRILQKSSPVEKGCTRRNPTFTECLNVEK